ncbi:MAG: alginate export family protein, partial [Polyangiaceae bacterium]
PWVIFERTRFGLGAERGPVGAQLTLQDARAWGTTPPLAQEGVLASAPSSFGPSEAYLDVHSGNGPRATFLRAGRQAVQWGEGRLIGISDWSPTGRSLDAIRGKWATGHWDFEALAVLLDAPRPLGQDLGEPQSAELTSGNELYGLRAAWTIDPLLKLEAFGIAEIARNGGGDSVLETARNSGETYVASLRVSGDSRGLGYGAEGAYEFGRAAALNDATRSAYALAAHVGKTFESIAIAPSIRVGVSYASGDDRAPGIVDTSRTTYKQFDPLLPDVHAQYGAMDIFSWSNTAEANARVGIAPTRVTKIEFEYRYAQLVKSAGEWLNGYLEPVGRTSSPSASLGHELDLGFAWRPWIPLDLRAGYSLLFLGEGAQRIMAAEGRGEINANGSITVTGTSHFAYLQATVSVP